MVTEKDMFDKAISVIVDNTKFQDIKVIVA